MTLLIHFVIFLVSAKSVVLDIEVEATFRKVLIASNVVVLEHPEHVQNCFTTHYRVDGLLRNCAAPLWMKIENAIRRNNGLPSEVRSTTQETLDNGRGVSARGQSEDTRDRIVDEARRASGISYRYSVRNGLVSCEFVNGWQRDAKPRPLFQPHNIQRFLSLLDGPLSQFELSLSKCVLIAHSAVLPMGDARLRDSQQHESAGKTAFPNEKLESPIRFGALLLLGWVAICRSFRLFDEWSDSRRDSRLGLSALLFFLALSFAGLVAAS